MLVVAIFTLLNVYSYGKSQQVTAGYRNVIDRNASLIFKVYAADVELARQATLLQRYLATGNDQHRQAFEESKVNMEAVFTSLDRDLITAEGKEGLQKVRQAVDAWHLAAMRLVNGRPAPAGTATMTTVAWPEELAVTAEREINAYVRFLQGRLHQRTEENIRVAEETQTLIIAANMALFVLATGISLWLWRRISVPLRNANRLAGEIAAGDLREKHLVCRDKDEIGQIVESMQVMNGNLRRLVGEIMTAAGKVAGACAEFTVATEGSADAAAHITVNMAEVAERAEAIFQEADEVHRQMQEIATRISQMAAHAVKAAAVAQTAEDSSRSGQALIDQVADQMRSINDATEKIGDAVEKLSTGSDEIAKFATIINGIAEQTHLLALNAAIEAARAGDAGRGFAVVAQEVNTLAAESAKSAKDVQAMIDSNRQNLAAVVAYVRTGLVGVKAGMEIAGATAMEFTTISREIARVSDLMREISEAVGELSAGGHRVVASVNRVKEKSGETAGRTQAISAAVQQQAASLQQMAGSGQSLDGLAQQMQDAVRKFAV
jgi:methyl-accepting chemotaxis protein